MELSHLKNIRAMPGPILITGHTGFKGTWLTLLLEQLGVDIIGVSLPAEVNSLYDRMNRFGKIPEAFVDVRDKKALSVFLENSQPSAIIHLAAQPLVLESYIQPRETFETNVMGTVNLLNCAFSVSSIKSIIIATTDKVYRNDNLGKAFVESDPLFGKDPYSASKVATEAVVSAWQQISKLDHGPSVISVRAGNVIGGGDWADNRLLPDIIRGFTSKETFSLRNPNSTRPWQHVLDPLYGYILTLEESFKLTDIESVNFGPSGESLTVSEVAKIAADHWPNQVGYEFSGLDIEENRESLVLQLDSTKARQILNWKPKWSQQESVLKTVSWWNLVLNQGLDPLDACKIDLGEFLN